MVLRVGLAVPRLVARPVIVEAVVGRGTVGAIGAVVLVLAVLVLVVLVVIAQVTPSPAAELAACRRWRQ